MGKEVINHPDHYKFNNLECIDEMLLIFGKKAVIDFCTLNAWKYRYRAMNKGKCEDLKKADWYINKIKELRNQDCQI